MSDAVDRALSENHALIAAILEHHAAGRPLSAVSLLERLQVNLEFITALSEHGIVLGGVPPPSTTAPPPTAPLPPPPPPPPAANAPTPATTTSAAPRIAPAAAGSATATGLPNQGGLAMHAAQGAPGTMYWSREEHARFEEGMTMFGGSGKDSKPNFKAIANHVGTRTAVQVRSHLQKVQKRAITHASKSPTS